MPVIYKITSPSNKVYVGQSWDWIKRKSVYKRKACNNQIKLYNSLLKYGYENHKVEIICELPEDITQCVLNSYEELYLQQYIDCDVPVLNIRKAGSNGKLSKETVEKMSKSLKGRVIKPESIKKMVETRKKNGYVMSEETRRKIGEGHKGKKISIEVKEKLRQVNLGKKLSEETIDKIRKASANRTLLEETKQKISESKKGNKNPMFGKKTHNSLKVIDLKSGRIFNSIREAEVINGINVGILVNKLNGRTKNNTSFRYCNDH